MGYIGDVARAAAVENSSVGTIYLIWYNQELPFQAMQALKLSSVSKFQNDCNEK